MNEVVRLEGQRSIDTLATRINEEHRACERAVVSAVEHAIAAGELLLEAKERAGHGNWGDWLRENFEGSERHAQRYMHIARGKDELNPTHVSDLSIRGALRELSAPTPERAPTLELTGFRYEVEQNIPLIVDPAFNFKKHPADFLDSLEASIRQVGLINWIIAWKQTRIILDGEARYKVCVRAGLPYDVSLVHHEDALEAELHAHRLRLAQTPLTEGERASAEARRAEVMAAMEGRT